MVARLEKSKAPSSAGRVPPHNLEAEESVLGACLLSREAIANVVEVVSPDDFYKPAHGEIFRSILGLYGRGEPVDAVTLSEDLRRLGIFESIGGAPYVHTLVSGVPTAGSAAHYARIVEEHALLRRLIEAAHSISEMAFAIPEEVSEAVDQAENLIYQVSRRRISEDFRELKELLTDHMELIEKLYEKGSSITGLATGFAELDKVTAGFQPSNLIIVAARPSMGKSSWAVTVAQHVAVNEQVPVVIFSMEMSKMELVQRLMCAEAHVDSNRLRRGALQDSDWPKLSLALGRLAEAPIFIDDTANLSIMEMRAKCRRLQTKHGLGLVIVDYLQLMQPLRRTDNRVQEVSEISRSLKILARELEVPVIAVSQLSRNVEYRSDKRPLLADLRESGCVTGDSKVALASGKLAPIASLVGQTPEVLTLDGWQVRSARASRVWRTGYRPVFRVITRSGRRIRATANHPFRVFGGWRRLDELTVGERVAVSRAYPEPPSPDRWDPRRVILLAHMIGDGSCLKNLPVRYASLSQDNIVAVAEAAEAFGIRARCVFEPSARSVQLFLPSPYRLTHGRRNPLVAWMDELGLFGKRSYQKFVPDPVFMLSNEQVSLFLRHLWATDGSVLVRRSKGPIGQIYYATTSSLLASQVQHLLARLSVNSTISTAKKHGYRDCYHVSVFGKTNQLAFIERVGGFGPRAQAVNGLALALHGIKANPNVDTIPVEVWEMVRARLVETGMTLKQLAKLRGVTMSASSAFRFAPSRYLLTEYSRVLSDPELGEIANSDIYWDEVRSIEADGFAEVFDMTVPGTHNFVANGICLHNSLEQDSDVVIFIYRDEVYNSDSPQKGIAEIHVSKHRNGPIGKVELTFLEHYTKFANLARGV